MSDIGPRKLIVLLAAATAMGPLAMQIYLPALPAVQSAFGTSLALTQLTFSAFVFAIGPAQLLYGPLADRWGRRPALIAGLLLCFAGSVACYLAPDIYWLIGARMIQAVGGAAGLVIARAILSDLYGTDEMAGRLATLVMVMVVAPTLAPLVGGYLTDWYGWRSLFLVVSVLGLLVTAAVLRWLPETLPDEDDGERESLTLGVKRLMGKPLFHAYTAQAVLSVGMFYVFISTAPYLMESVMGRPAREYGFWFLLLAGGYTLGNLTSTRYSHRLGVDGMILRGSLVAAVGTLAMVSLTGAGWWAPMALFLPMTVVTYSSGLAAPNAQTGAVRQSPRRAGTASSLLGFSQQTVGALLVQFVSMLDNDSPVTLAVFLLVLGLLSVACALAIRALGARAAQAA
ncbi:multidrug effflux MFS transporter [Lentisalinibacter sediminis]|uniref:multidrug effflux MFS transporter n=1 Tax=Lentisalinibacter sediminis TaxID=2992237 RepID=UPI00386D5819